MLYPTKNPPVSINPDREMTGFDSHKGKNSNFSEEFHHADFSTGGDVIWGNTAQAVDIQNLMHPISLKNQANAAVLWIT